MKFFYQENCGTIEILLETKDGFTWICDCGSSSHPNSKITAQVLCKLLNANKQVAKRLK